MRQRDHVDVAIVKANAALGADHVGELEVGGAEHLGDGEPANRDDQRRPEDRGLARDERTATPTWSENAPRRDQKLPRSARPSSVDTTSAGARDQIALTPCASSGAGAKRR